ncbi:MAG: hypothetical protein WB819_04800 [Terriglobia bacterium]
MQWGLYSLQAFPQMLGPELILELKAEAKARGVPCQVLMRMFIIDGFKRPKRAS